MSHRQCWFKASKYIVLFLLCCVLYTHSFISSQLNCYFFFLSIWGKISNDDSFVWSQSDAINEDKLRHSTWPSLCGFRLFLLSLCICMGCAHQTNFRVHVHFTSYTLHIRVIDCAESPRSLLTTCLFLLISPYLKHNHERFNECPFCEQLREIDNKNEDGKRGIFYLALEIRCPIIIFKLSRGIVHTISHYIIESKNCLFNFLLLFLRFALYVARFI